MNKRAIYCGLSLAVIFAATLKGQEADYSVKVTSVDHANEVVEAKFVIVPQDLRIVCYGDPGKVYVDDYIKVIAKNGTFKIGKAVCSQIKWLR